MWIVRILIEVIDSPGVKEGGSALDPMDFVAFGEEELSKVGSILSSDPCDQGFFQFNASRWLMSQSSQFNSNGFRTPTVALPPLLKA